MKKSFYIYILANKRNGTLYIGVTSNLVARIYQHKNNFAEGFTQKHQIHNLVYFEVHDRIEDAIAREKALKFWKRAWKIRLIEENNSEWDDLYDGIA